MHLIHGDKQKRIIKQREEINFSSFSSYHLIAITARAKSKKQISKKETDDEDLMVKIDEKTFPKSIKSKRLIDSPAAFSGGKLHNLSKTVYFLTFIKGKNHTISLEPDDPPGTAALENLKIYTLNLAETLSLEIENQAEDGDRRPWITFVLDDLPLTSVAPTITYSRRKRDSDDVKILIDGKNQANLLRRIKHFLWHYIGSLIPQFSSRTKTETFSVKLPKGLHYIEFHADRMPTLHKLLIDLGDKPSFPKDIPPADNPKWTGDFYDDTPQMILARTIYGEVGGEPKEAKIAVGWVIRNRVDDSRWDSTYHEVILTPYQFEPFIDPNKDIFKKISNPPMENTFEKAAWYESYQAAETVLFGKEPDPTNGANHFHAMTDLEKPSWADENNLTIKIGATRFYKL